MSDFFYNKDIVAASPKKNFLYTNAHLNGEDGSRKVLNLEWGNGITERSTEEKYYIKIPWHRNVQNISTPISDTVDVYHKDKPVQK